MVVGAYLLAENLGFSLPFSIWDFLPVPFLALGVLGLSFPGRHLSRSGGVWMLGVGLYLACGIFNLLGLSWNTAWPIFIIGAGLSVILRRDDCWRRGRGPNRVTHGA
jgi:hypothetical protein